jgi:hypothetical protein
MFAFRTLPAVTAIMSLSLTGLLAPEASARQQVATASSDEYSLQFDDQKGEKLIDVIELFQGLLDVPISYNSAEVEPVTLFMKGPLTVPGGDMRHMLEALLEPLGFVSWDSPEGEPPLISVARRVPGTPPMHWPNQIVPLESLDQQPERRTVFYTVVIPLLHADARNSTSVFSTFLNYDGESFRSISNTNCILIKSYSLSTLRQIRDVVQFIDIDSEESMDYRHEIDLLKMEMEKTKGK